MTLPKIDLPIFELKLPSDSREITVRPFTVKEEKLLLMALESKNEKEIVSTTKQVVNNCILTEDVTVDTLPFFDVDYLFIALRAKAIGESIEVNFTCNHRVDGLRCGQIFPATIDINNCEIVQTKEVSKTIKLSESIQVKMKYPTYEVMKRIVDTDTDLDKKSKIIAECVAQVVTPDNVYTPKDFSKEEFKDYIETFTRSQYAKLEEFVDNFPSFHVVAKAACPKCKTDHTIHYTDFTSFFR